MAYESLTGPSESRPSREMRLQRLLSTLQHDIEYYGTEATKARRRAVLRGIRVAVWAMDGGMSVKDLSRELRAELFDWPADAWPPAKGENGADPGAASEVCDER